MEREITVTDCNDCPFCGMSGYEGEISVCRIFGNKTISATAELFGKIVKAPKWCPLKYETVLIKKANGEQP